MPEPLFFFEKRAAAGWRAQLSIHLQPEISTLIFPFLRALKMSYSLALHPQVVDNMALKMLTFSSQGLAELPG